MASIKLKGDTSGEITISAPSVAGTNTLNLQASSGTLATTAQASIGMKNLIINGNMQIAQRGTSTTGLQYNKDNIYPSCDRWQFSEFGSTSYTAAFTGEQSTDVPNGQGFANSFKLDCTTADATLEADTAVVIRQMIEAQNLQHLKYGTSNAESITLSFWVKSNITGTFTIVLNHVDGAKYYGADYTIDTANTWEKKTLTIEGNTSNAIDNDNNIGFRVQFYLAVGSNYASGTNEQWTSGTDSADIAPNMTNNIGGSTSNYINITGVQLEVGTTATPFEYLQYGQQLALCQRYYFKSYSQGTSIGTATNVNGFFDRIGSGNNVTNRVMNVEFPVEMRSTPSIYSYDFQGTGGRVSDCTTAYTHQNSVTVSGYIAIGTKRFGGFSVGTPFDATLGSQLTANAEL
jgi:hypothetical protein